MTECRDIFPKVGALADGNLDDEAMRAHVESCAVCRREFDQVRRLREALRRVVLPRAVRRPIAWPKWAAAAAAVLVVATLLLLRDTTPAEALAAAARFDESSLGGRTGSAPDIGIGVEGWAAGELAPMVFYRAGDKRVSLIMSPERFPDLPATQNVGGVDCAVYRHGTKTVMFCGTERGHHIWVAEMSPEALMALVGSMKTPDDAPAGGIPFAVRPMGCAACWQGALDCVLEVPGIARAYVDPAGERLVVVPADEGFDTRRVVEALEARGYEVDRS